MDFDFKFFEDKDGRIVLSMSAGTAIDFMDELGELITNTVLPEHGYELAERIQKALRQHIRNS